MDYDLVLEIGKDSSKWRKRQMEKMKTHLGRRTN